MSPGGQLAGQPIEPRRVAVLGRQIAAGLARAHVADAERAPEELGRSILESEMVRDLERRPTGL